MKINVSKTKSNLPCLWERGGGCRNTGNARVICGADGSKKVAIAIGHWSNDDHALFVLHDGDLIISVFESRSSGLEIDITEVKLSQIKDDLWCDSYGVYKDVDFKTVMSYSDGEWDNEPSPGVEEAIQSAVDKARCYHCREPYWYLPPKKRY